MRGGGGLGLKGQEVLREKDVRCCPFLTLQLGYWAHVLKLKEKSRNTDGEEWWHPLWQPTKELQGQMETYNPGSSRGTSTPCPMVKQLPKS